jgi:hypothetical protein
VKDHAQERPVDKKFAVVLNEPQLAETIHEEIDARTCRPDHFSQYLLAYLGITVSGSPFLLYA